MQKSMRLKFEPSSQMSAVTAFSIGDPTNSGSMTFAGFAKWQQVALRPLSEDSANVGAIGLASEPLAWWISQLGGGVAFQYPPTPCTRTTSHPKTPIPYTVLPTRHTLHPTPTPYTSHPTSCTSDRTPRIMANRRLYIPNPNPPNPTIRNPKRTRIRERSGPSTNNS